MSNTDVLVVLLCDAEMNAIGMLDFVEECGEGRQFMARLCMQRLKTSD